MTQIVHVSRLNPKTTEEDFQRFCERFGNVIECVIYPENDKMSKRSGHVKFALCQSAENMYHQSLEETLYINQTSIDVELRQLNPKITRKSLPQPIYLLDIQGQIIDENELIKYFNGKPITIKFFETIDNNGESVKTGARVSFNDKDLVERILKQNHEKYTITLISNNLPIKRACDQEQSNGVKRSKLSQNSYSSLTSHLEMINKLTQDINEENERLKNENSLLTITMNQQLTKIKQLEREKTELVNSLTQTHEIAKCLTNKFKSREDEHKITIDEVNQTITDFKIILQTAENEIERLTKHIKTLENQLQDLTEKHIQSKITHLAQQNDIKHFFLALENTPN